MKIEYDPSRKKYLLDAKVTTKARVISALRAEGLTCRRADLLLHLCKLVATVNNYFEEPEPEPSTYRRLFCHMVVNALDRELSLRKAARWVHANLRPGTIRRSVGSVKHDCDHAFQRLGSACYLRDSDFGSVLRRCGYLVRNGEVRIEKVPA